MINTNEKIKYSDLAWPLKIGFIGGIIQIVGMVISTLIVGSLLILSFMYQ